MTLAAFAATCLALLLAPGPTNTLMAVAGAQGGLARPLRLLPAELAGYLCALVPLGLVGESLLTRWPQAAEALALLAALWVLLLARHLWRRPSAGTDSAPVGAGRVFVTTLLNPKALIFGLVLMPTPLDAGYGQHLAVFGLLVALVALAWGSAGALTRRGRGAALSPLWVQRAAALWLGVVSASLAFAAVSA